MAVALESNGGRGAEGSIGSANEATPGQWRVVVAWGTPSAASDANVSQAGGAPWGVSAPRA